MLDSIESAIEDIRKGKLIIVVDDEDRENEGDLIGAAKHVTSEMINFMSKHGRGLICAPLIEERCDELELELMVKTIRLFMKRHLLFLWIFSDMVARPE